MFIYLICCCVMIFFFFKQKTAYEMRISDWSSDVCSSDLVALPVSHRATQWFVHMWARFHRFITRFVLGQRVIVEGAMPDSPLQIGRASCRERVCQYV